MRGFATALTALNDMKTAGALPPQELLAALRQGKAALHRERRALSLPEKVSAVVEGLGGQPHEALAGRIPWTFAAES